MRLLSFIKKAFKKITIIAFLAGMILIIALAYFFISKDAPLIHGEVIFHQEYKEGLTLDIYLPTQNIYEQSPVVLFFHGGAWITGSKEAININRFNGAINILRDKGYTVLSPNYTLARNGKAPFPDCIMDAYDAIRWIENNADRYNFDLENVGVFGESAGAHIAMMAGYVDSEIFSTTKNTDISLKYVVDVYGPNDLERLYHMQTLDSINALLSKLPDPLKEHLDIAQHLFGFDPELNSEKAQVYMDRYSPINFLTRNSPPTLMIHGIMDQIVPIDQSLILHEKLDSLKVENEIHALENVNHAFRGASIDQKEDVQEWIVGFIDKQYYK